VGLWGCSITVSWSGFWSWVFVKFSSAVTLLGYVLIPICITSFYSKSYKKIGIEKSVLSSLLTPKKVFPPWSLSRIEKSHLKHLDQLLCAETMIKNYLNVKLKKVRLHWHGGTCLHF
jgi:hypothetical protein